MDILFKIVDFLKGKKSYIVGVMMITIGLLNEDKQMIMEGLSVMALRAGIAKN